MNVWIKKNLFYDTNLYLYALAQGSQIGFDVS